MCIDAPCCGCCNVPSVDQADERYQADVETYEAYCENEPNPFDDEPSDGFATDAEADADALASAGHGTDEDYFMDYEDGLY